MLIPLRSGAATTTGNLTMPNTTQTKPTSKRAANAVKPAPTVAKPAAKPANIKSAKRAATISAKPAKPVAPTSIKPTVEAAKPAAPVSALSGVALERAAASAAIRAFYGLDNPRASLPFKAGSHLKRLSQVNPAIAFAPSARTGGLIACLLHYGAGNVKPDGTFVRGAFVLPARLVDPKLPATDTVTAGPESGCLSNCLGHSIEHVSGDLGGPNARDAVFRIRLGAIQHIPAAMRAALTKASSIPAKLRA